MQNGFEKIEATLRRLTPGELGALAGACPDSETFASYIQDQVDQQTRGSINQHIAFCSECYSEYVALADPEAVLRELDQELQSHQPQSSQ